MKVLVTGSRGFIGSCVVQALARRGHAVVRGVSPRTAPAQGEVVMDFERDDDPALWHARLDGVDCAINTVGVIGGVRMSAVHVGVPAALFAAFARRGAQAINVSALGADDGARTAFHRTKRAADDALLANHPFATVVQPALVFGPGGASACLFAMLATLPLIPLPGAGEQRVQPIHVGDVADAIASIAGNRRYAGQRVALVGPAPVTLRELLAQLREALGLGRARFVTVPGFVMRAAVALRLPLVDRDMLSMLERGNTSDSSATAELLGHAPRPVSQFVAASDRRAAVTGARLAWLLPLLRISLAIMWLTAGVVSAGVYPIADSLALVARMGVQGTLAYVLLYAGVAVDLAFGVATLVMTRRRALWLLQMAVIAGYTALITSWLPEFWLHPYGPVVKNLPILCALWLLYELEER